MNYALTAEAIAIAVPVAIATWEHIALRSYRKIDQERAAVDQERAAARAVEEEAQRQRLERRDSWKVVFDDIHETLRRSEDVASEAKIRALDRRAMADLKLAQLQGHLENLSTRCPTSLIAPLRAVAAAINDLRGLPFPADDEKVSAPEATASALGVKAILQCQAAIKLQEAVMAAWEAVQNEWGSS